MTAPSERGVAVAFGVAALALEALASAIYATGAGVAAGFGDAPAAFLHSHAGTAIRIGSVVDMFG